MPGAGPLHHANGHYQLRGQSWETDNGEEIANETFPDTTAGGNRALSWILRHSVGTVHRVLLSIEGTNSYGAKLRYQAAAAGFRATGAPATDYRLGRYLSKSG